MTKAKLDDVFLAIGDFGTFQKLNYVLMICGWTVSLLFMLLSVFLIGVPEHRCSIPGLDNDTFKVQGSYHQKMISMYIPKGEDDKLYQECSYYDYNVQNNRTGVNFTLKNCDSWVYSKDVFKNTFVSELNLVCGDKHKTALLKTIFFGGVLVGSIGFGFLSDLIGRKMTLKIAVFCLAALSLGLAWVPNYTIYAMVRFGIGVCNAGLFLTVYVISTVSLLNLCMEWVGPSKRTWVGLLISIFSPLSELLMTLIGYLWRDWHYIEISMAVPVIIYFFVTWIVFESPRWLLSKGRIEEAKQLLRKAAEVNKTKFSPTMLEELESEEKPEAGRLWLVFKSRVLFIRSLIIFYNWMIVSMTFYGLSLNTGNLYGDFYVTFLISILVEFPGHIIPMLTLGRFGRKRVHGSFMLIAGLACLATIFSVNFGGKDLQSLTTALAMVGKCGATAAFSTVYVYSAELFPTVVRNAGMGASSSCARVGAMIAPFIVEAFEEIGGSMGKTLPIVVFGGASVVAAILTLFLPETLNRNLPESIEDGINFGKKNDSKKGREYIVEIATVQTSKM